MADTTSSTASMPSFARALRVAAFAEGVSYLVLLVAVVAKYGFDAANEGGVPILGPIHGIIVMIYAGLVLMGREEQGWDIPRTLLALALSAVPAGGFYVEQRMITVPPRTSPA